MNKQTPLALLMATIAIFMLAIACGSSDNTTTTPNQGLTTRPATEPTSPPATETATGPTTSTQTTSQTAGSTPEPTSSTPGTTPWPTPLPTRTIPPTPRNPDQQTATAAAPPPTEQAQGQETPESPESPSPTTDVLPEYDGASPLIHVYVEEPFILFESEVGKSITLPIKGLTQDDERVSVSNPTKWGITFTTIDKPYHQFDERGVYTILKKTGHLGGAAKLQFNLRGTPSYATVFHLPKERIGPPATTSQRLSGNPQCWVEYGSLFEIDLQWFLILLPTKEDQPRLEQLALEIGAISHGPHYYHRGDSLHFNQGYSSQDQSYILVEFSPERCPTLQDTLQARKTVHQTPGVQGTRNLNPHTREIWYPK